MKDPLERLLWIDLPEDIETDMGAFKLNPSVPLPIEPEEGETLDLENVTWERIIAACLLLLANSPSHEHAAYYRDFLGALRPNLAEELLAASEERIGTGDWSSAEDILLALRGFMPESPAGLRAMALYYDRRSADAKASGEREASESYGKAAEAAYSELLSEDSAPTEAWYEAGSFRYRNGDFLKAAETLESYLEAAQEGDHAPEARRLVSFCRDQGQADALYRDAFAALKEGRVEEGTGMARRFRDGKPDGWPGWFLLGWGLRLSEQWAEAKEALEGARDRGCTEGDLFNELAICSRALGEYDASAEALEQALRQDPGNVKIVSNMAVLQLEKGDEAEAVRWLQTALAMDPDDPVCKAMLEKLEGGT